MSKNISSLETITEALANPDISDKDRVILETERRKAAFIQAGIDLGEAALNSFGVSDSSQLPWAVVGAVRETHTQLVKLVDIKDIELHTKFLTDVTATLKGDWLEASEVAEEITNLGAIALFEAELLLNEDSSK